jgi:hypothetical protein
VEDGPEAEGPVTIVDRLTSAGLSAERISWWLSQEPGSVRVDEEPVTSPDHPAASPAHVVLRS